MDKINDIKDNFETIQSITEIIQNADDIPNVSSNSVRQPQSGGFLLAALSIPYGLITFVKDFFVVLAKCLYDLFRIDGLNDNTHVSGAWKYLWFCVQCGFYLIVFAVTGPIFMLFGISMIYMKLFKKMSDDGTETPGSFFDKTIQDADV